MKNKAKSEIKELRKEIILHGSSDLMKSSMSYFMSLRETHPKEFEKLCFETLEAIYIKTKTNMLEYFHEQKLKNETT